MQEDGQILITVNKQLGSIQHNILNRQYATMQLF